MDIDLLNVTTEKLLEKFGAGNHKPGSGSAAAFQGMLSAKLLVTVISLTNEAKRRETYKNVLPKLLRMDNEIHNRIFPRLKDLFQEDAIQFGKTIKAREERDNERNIFEKNRLGLKALRELKLSVEIPITIAEFCIELADIADYVFDNAFQSARGDSQVALNGAAAGIAGCLSIVQLNLLSFGCDENDWTSNIIKKTDKLKIRYNEINQIANSKIEVLENEVTSKAILHTAVEDLLKQIKSKSKTTDTDIEKAANDLQNLMWIHRKKIWKKNVPNHPINVIKPSIALKKALGYHFAITDGIALINNGNHEIAGLIHQDEKIVLVSDRFEKNTQNFTAAHELGHAVLHKQTVMHRDRPVDGSYNNKKRSLPELQADRFATHFLMPKKIVIEIFQELFQTDRFIIEEDSAFHLIKGSSEKLRMECKSLRGLSYKLASAERYRDESFKSISELFNVSVSAMAIRLEELGLVVF